MYCAACATIYSLAPLSPRALAHTHTLQWHIDWMPRYATLGPATPCTPPAPCHTHAPTSSTLCLAPLTASLSVISALNFSLQRTLRDSVRGALLRRYATIQGYRKPGHEGHAAERGARGAGVLSESRATFGPCPKVEQDPPAAISTAFSSAEGGRSAYGGRGLRHLVAPCRRGEGGGGGPPPS